MRGEVRDKTSFWNLLGPRGQCPGPGQLWGGAVNWSSREQSSEEQCSGAYKEELADLVTGY